MDPVEIVARIDNKVAVVDRPRDLHHRDHGHQHRRELRLAGLRHRQPLPEARRLQAGGLITSILAVLVCPWIFVDSPKAITIFVSRLRRVLAPMYGVMVADYYLVKREVVDTPELYTMDAERPLLLRRRLEPGRARRRSPSRASSRSAGSSARSCFKILPREQPRLADRRGRRRRRLHRADAEARTAPDPDPRGRPRPPAAAPSRPCRPHGTAAPCPRHRRPAMTVATRRVARDLLAGTVLAALLPLAAAAQETAVTDKVILLINPNSNAETTASMTEIAATRQRRRHRRGQEQRGRAAAADDARGPRERDPGRREDRRAGAADPRVGAIIVAAFGDPGLEELRAAVDLPVFGIREQAFHEAAQRRAPVRRRDDDPVGPRRVVPQSPPRDGLRGAVPRHPRHPRRSRTR